MCTFIAHQQSYVLVLERIPLLDRCFFCPASVIGYLNLNTRSEIITKRWLWPAPTVLLHHSSLVSERGLWIFQIMGCSGVLAVMASQRKNSLLVSTVLPCVYSIVPAAVAQVEEMSLRFSVLLHCFIVNLLCRWWWWWQQPDCPSQPRSLFQLTPVWPSPMEKKMRMFFTITVALKW